MTQPRRFVCVLSAFILMLSVCAFLVGCGKQPAATWAQGEIAEDKVTSAVSNMRSYYGITDDATWASFVKQRGYDSSKQTSENSGVSALGKAKEGSSGDIDDALLGANVEQGDSADASQEGTEEGASGNGQEAVDETGTVEEMRDYVIEQLVRQEIINKEIEKRGIKVSDEEVDAFVDQVRSYVESQYMPGVFESYLQMQGYKDLNAYKEEARTQLIQAKLQQEIATTTAEDGTESIDQSKWTEWLDGMYADAAVKINPAPSDLPYAIVETSESTSASQSSSASESSE